MGSEIDLANSTLNGFLICICCYTWSGPSQAEGAEGTPIYLAGTKSASSRHEYTAMSSGALLGNDLRASGSAISLTQA